MKTLINAQFYQVTDDFAVLYNGMEIPITDDGHQNWCIVADDNAIPLNTFEVDGVLWYFSNDYQELEISQFVTQTLPDMGIPYTDIEWFKSLPDPDEEWNYQVYFKYKGRESYRSYAWQTESEETMIGQLTTPEYISWEGHPDEWLCLCGNNSSDYGFYTCNSKGEEMEPLIRSDWNGLYVCGRCGRIINGDTRKVVGRKPMDEQ